MPWWVWFFVGTLILSLPAQRGFRMYVQADKHYGTARVQNPGIWNQISLWCWAFYSSIFSGMLLGMILLAIGWLIVKLASLLVFACILLALLGALDEYRNRS